jgi:hypothetical protein
MLASLLPDAVLRDTGLTRLRANMVLMLFGRYDIPASFAGTVEQEFARVVWSKLAPQRRMQPAFFSAASPLRLIAGDARFWMNRICRIALDRRENRFTPVTKSDDSWPSMSEPKPRMEHKSRYARSNCCQKKGLGPNAGVVTLQHREQHDDASDDAGQAD